MQSVAVQSKSKRHILAAGVTGGIIGGLFFGLFLAIMGSLPMIAQLMGSQSAAVGFLVHMVISAVFGAVFGIVLEQQLVSLRQSAILGLLYGIFWWLVGALLLMPLLLGMSAQFSHAFAPANLLSLAGHMVYGIVLGVTVILISRSEWISQR